jgi:hypothetical protein
MNVAAKLAVVALVVFCAAPVARADAKDKDRPPTKLWHAFPLRQQPRSGVEGAVVQRIGRPPLAASEPAATDLTVWLIVSMLAAAGAGVALTVLRLRREAPVAVGASPAPSALPASPVPPAHGEVLVGARESARIAVWRGYVMSCFVARRARSGGAYAVSPEFRARGSEVERTPAAERALAFLLHELDRAGWSVVYEGPEWFDRELERFRGRARGPSVTPPSSRTDRP